jgi:hypothetical protein
VLLEFPPIVAAVEGAVLMQRKMAERNAALPEDKRILYRIGVNLGDVLTLETLRKRDGAHMPGFTPARTRYQLAGKLAMNPRTMPICIMNQ